jgi:mRNA interferase RelE/StbE
MADYKVVWKRSAVKELENLPAGMAGKIVSNVEQLAENLFPAGTRKLVGSENLYRIRVGDYRVIYDI